jgi:hypothetical protein
MGGEMMGHTHVPTRWQRRQPALAATCYCAISMPCISSTLPEWPGLFMRAAGRLQGLCIG